MLLYTDNKHIITEIAAMKLYEKAINLPDDMYWITIMIIAEN